jgi:hypothetical protein
MKEKVRVQSFNPNILQQGKSKRLAAIRQRLGGNNEQHNPQQLQKKQPASELVKAQKKIDQAIDQWLLRYPPAKKQRFFKIRFGLSIDQLKKLPLQEIYRKLELAEQAPEKIAKLDYNGRLCSHLKKRDENLPD